MNCWYEFNCPTCNAKCFLDNGDPFDHTQSDHEGFECWNCKTSYKIEPDGELCETNNETFLEADMNPALDYQAQEKVKKLVEEIDGSVTMQGSDERHVRWLIKELTGL